MSLGLLILALATWRLSSLLVQETGPGRVFVKLRELTGITHTDDGRVLSYGDWTPLYCIWCTSMYVSVVLLFVPLIVLMPLAISTLAIVIHEKLT